MPVQRIPRTEQFLQNQQRPVSRWRLTKVAIDSVSGARRFQFWKPPTLPVLVFGEQAVEGVHFVRHIVGRGEVGRPDIIAHTYYEDETFWWVIAYVNNIDNPLTDMYPGQNLRIPPREDVIEGLRPA